MKNLKKTLKASVLALGLLSVLSVSSYAGGFACVDTQEVMQKSTFAKSLGKSLNEKVAKIRKKLQAYEAELQNLQKEIESKAISKQAKKQK
ncbi:MAG: OmpH family outer membrane protein, partial [Hydrogenobaculum sp.]